MTDLSQLTDAQLLALTQGGSNITPAPQPVPVQAAPLAPLPGANVSADYNAGLDPSKLSDAQLSAIIADTNPQMSTGEDVARSALGGVQRGTAGLATSSRGISDTIHGLAQSGVDFAARHGVGDGKLQLPPVDALLHPPGTMGVGEALHLATKAGAGLANKVLPSWAQINPGVAQMALDTASPTAALSQQGPSGEQGAVAMNNSAPIHAPQTTLGRYAMRAGEMAPLAVSNPVTALVSAIASQGTEDVAPKDWKPAAALAGAILGGGAVAAGKSVLRAPQASFGRAMGDLSDEQINRAQALRTQAAARGIDLTLPEAVQQVTDNGTGLGRLQHTIENTEQGKTLTAPYFANRPDQVAQAVRAYAGAIAPATDQPGMVGVNGQAAAQDVLQAAERARTAHVTPDYQAADPQRVPAATMETVLRNIDAQIGNDRTGLLGGRLGELRDALTETPARPGREAVPPERVQSGATYKMVGGNPAVPATPRVPLTDIENLDRVRKYFRDRMTQPPLGSDAFTKEQAGAITSHLLGVDRLMETVPEFAAGKDKFQQFTQTVNAPLGAGPLGKIANTDSVKAQTGALYPSIPTEGAPNETALAVRLLGANAPGTADALTRQHLINALNESASELQGGQNQYSGAKLAVSLAGNPEQAAALRSGIGALPGGEARATDLDNLLEALRATGKRQPPGSMTAFNTEALQKLHIAPSANALGRIADPLEWGKGIGDILNRANYRRNVDRLAAMIMAAPEDTVGTLNTARDAASRSGGGALLPAAIMAHGNARR